MPNISICKKCIGRLKLSWYVDPETDKQMLRNCPAAWVIAYDEQAPPACRYILEQTLQKEELKPRILDEDYYDSRGIE